MAAIFKGKKQLDLNDSKHKEKLAAEGTPANQFKFVERGTQSRNSILRDVETQTKAPPIAVFSGAINKWVHSDLLMGMEVKYYLVRWMIHDEYVKYENNEKEKENRQQQTFSDENVKLRRKLTVEKINSQKIDVNKKMLLSAKVIERMIAQNIHSEVSYDYKYWEDRSDEFKEFEGTLYPLWTFGSTAADNLAVTCLCWSPTYQDLFAVGFGSYDFYHQPDSGTICLFSLKNSSYPELTLHAPAGVLCLDLHPVHPHLLVAGLVDGNVAVYNLLRNGFQTDIKAEVKMCSLFTQGTKFLP